MSKIAAQNGFTVVELLITLFIAAAFLVSGYQLFNLIIKDGGQTRAESRASNVAYDYLRKYSSSAVFPCVATKGALERQSVTRVKLTHAHLCLR